MTIVCLTCLRHWTSDHFPEKHTRCLHCQSYSIEPALRASCCDMLLGKSEIYMIFEDGFVLCGYCASES